MKRIGIAVAEFYPEMAAAMLDAARHEATEREMMITAVSRVNGVYDLPLAVQRLLARDDVKGVVTLGVVIEGETGHDAVVAEQAARAFIDLALSSGKPVTLGVIGPKASKSHAEARKREYAVRAVAALGKLL